MIDWSHWHNEPFLVGGLIFLGWAYAILTGPLRGKLVAYNHRLPFPRPLSPASRPPHPVPSAPDPRPRTPDPSPQLPSPSSRLPPPPPYPRRHAVRFYLALFFFYLAVGSPLDQIGERFLFSAHMLQHQLIVYPAAILLLLGLPDWLVRPVFARPGLRPILRPLLHPIVCGTVYVVVVSAWHAPLLYDWALQDKTVHIVEHFTFFGAALFLWWPLCSPSADHPPVSYPGQMFYLLAITIGMTPLFAYITFSPDVLYPTYEYAPRVVGLSPLQDQVLAGTMMKLVGLCVSLGAFAVAFYRWHQSSEPRPRAA